MGNAFETKPHQIVRADHPAITFYWIAESEERGRPVVLFEVSCLFCKRTLLTDVRGSFSVIINAPTSLLQFGMGLTVRCKLCKQSYRIIVAESFLG